MKTLLVAAAMMVSLLTLAQDKKAGMPDTMSFVKVDIKDGGEIFGKLIKDDGKQITVSTKRLGEVTIQKSSITHISVINEEDIKNGNYWFPNPNCTRYFVSTSGFALEPGEGYYQNNYLFLNSVYVGITKNISIGAGIELISTFSPNSGGPIFYVTPKASFELSEKVNAGGGILYASIPNFGYSERNRTSLGIGYGVLTYGSKDNNITAGLGYGFVDDKLSSKPIVTLSGMTRIGRNASLVTENWFYPQKQYRTQLNSVTNMYESFEDGYKYKGFISYGVRFFGENISVDLGFINSKDIMNFIPIGIPYVDFVVKFGGKNKK